MKRLFSPALISASLAVVLAIPVAALAAVAPAETPPGSTLEARVAQRKNERALVLTPEDQKRVVNSCTGAQAKLRTIRSDLVSKASKQTKIYQQVDAYVWTLVGQLKLAEQDTYNLEKQHLELQQKMEAYKSVNSDLQQALDDTILMNCQADAVGFKSMVETLRLYYIDLRKQSADNRAFVVNTIKPELAGHINDLQPAAPSTETSETSEDDS